MLLSLHIRDLALLTAAELRFAPGLNVLSGETGGGKSLVVAALQLLRGARARAGLVRRGAPELRVDAEFALPAAGAGGNRLRERVAELCGQPLEGDVLVVTRIVDAAGRSRARVDGRPATLQVLRQLAGLLLEVHGQGQTQLLLEPARQAELLDAFSGAAELFGAYRAVRRLTKLAAERLDGSEDGRREATERAEFLRFQLQEMETVELREGEYAAVTAEHQLLANLDRLREVIDTASDALDASDTAAVVSLARAGRALERGVAFDPQLAAAVELVETAQVAASEAASVLQSRAAALDLDPGRLQELDERLAGLRRALQRFGPEESDFLARLAHLRDDLAELDEQLDAAGPERLQQDFDARLAELQSAALALHDARRRGAARLAAAVHAELGDLGMPQATFRIDLPERLPRGRALLEAGSDHGPTPVEFEVCPNPGEPWQSLRRTASGGEAARLVLALRKCLAAQDQVPTVVFDEIDAEVGGRLGLQVGAKLQELAVEHQVLVVTHLPQVAAFADCHLRVRKEVRDQRSVSLVEHLQGAEADRELAAMAAGEDGDVAALREARRLRERARRLRPAARRAAAG